MRRASKPHESDAALATDRADAKSSYRSVVDALENYVGAWRRDPDPGNGPAPSGRVRSATENYVVPKDVAYAANDLSELLTPDLADAAAAVNAVPSIDLSDASLELINLRGTDVSWIRGKYFAGIDLRGATLVDTRWGSSTFSDALLQCANLTGASFSDSEAASTSADLRNADLRGADLEGVDLRKVDLTGADLGGADLKHADLRGARLFQTDFGKADVTDARFGHNKAVADAIGLGTTVHLDVEASRSVCLEHYR